MFARLIGVVSLFCLWSTAFWITGETFCRRTKITKRDVVQSIDASYLLSKDSRVLSCDSKNEFKLPCLALAARACPPLSLSPPGPALHWEQSAATCKISAFSLSSCTDAAWNSRILQRSLHMSLSLTEVRNCQWNAQPEEVPNWIVSRI